MSPIKLTFFLLLSSLHLSQNDVALLLYLCARIQKQQMFR